MTTEHNDINEDSLDLESYNESFRYFEFDSTNAVYEWDNEKDHSNYTKHGIHFRLAAKVFLDSNKLIRYDRENSRTEDRYNILGKVGKVLFVVCVFEEDSVVRLISARIATKNEKKRYENGEDYYE